MVFNTQEIKQLQQLLLSPEDANKTIALGMIQHAPTNVPFLKTTLCIAAYLSKESRQEIEGIAHDLLIENLSEEAVIELQNQIIILDYAQYKFKVSEGWNSFQSPLRRFLSLHEAVIEDYYPLFKIYPEYYSQLYVLLANRIQKEWKNIQKTFYYYELALKICPNNTQAQFGYAMIRHVYYIKKGEKLDEVETVLNYYLNAYKSPKNINAYKNAAMLCKDIGAIDRAAYYYEEGLLRCPNDTSLLNNYANLLMKYSQNYTKAKELVEKGLSINAIDTALIDTLAHIEFLGFQQYELAESLFQKALSKDGDHHYSYTGLGDLQAHLGNYPLAESYYLKGLHNGLKYTSREVFEVVEKLEKLVVFYTFYLINLPKADYYNQKLARLKNKR